MKTRYGISPWVHTFPETRRRAFPKLLRGEYSADVVIVGGGLTACATAYACAAAGMRPWVLEAERIGQGQAGRSAGLLLPDPGPSFKDLTAAHGLRAGRRMFEGWRRASLEAAALVRRLKLRCDLTPASALQIAFDDEKNLKREYEARVAAGLDVQWLPPKQVRQNTGLSAIAAIGMHDAFGLDPYRACLGMASAAAARGAKIFEKSPVTRVRAAKKDVEILLGQTVVRAGTVIVATGTATSEFAPLRRHFKRRQSYLVLTEPMPAAMRKQMGKRDATVTDTRVPPHRIRWTADDRILVAGADQDEPPARLRDAVLRQRTGQLMYELLMMYPDISGLQPEYGWESTYGQTADGVPYIGPHRNYPRHLFAIGGAHDSVTGAFLAARILFRALRGEPQKGDEVFGWTR